MSGLFERAGEVVRDETSLVRPLGELSNFVVNQAPALLREVRAGSFAAATELQQNFEQLAVVQLKSAEHPFNPADPDSCTARLDVMLANRMIRLAGLNPGENTLALVNSFTPAGYVPDSTYGDLLFANPQTDMRTLSGDNREADFYRAHTQIELPLHAFTEKLAASMAADTLTADTEELLADSQPFDLLLGNMVLLYRGLTDFNEVIRPSLMSIPDYPYHGPSGVDSATVYSLDLLVSGQTLPEEFFQFLQQNYDYFYPAHRNLLNLSLQLAGRNTSLTSMAEGGNAAAQALKDKVLQTLVPFRRAHRNAVVKHIPDAVLGTTDGTGGIAASNLLDFLRQRELMHGT